MLKDFKAFIMRGNVLDLAVAVVIGGAFGAIVKSLVDDIIMPVVGLLLGGVDLASLQIVLKDATATSDAVAIRYGLFLGTVVTFIIVALVVFLIAKWLLPKPGPMRDCPYCGESVNAAATRCKFCTSELTPA